MYSNSSIGKSPAKSYNKYSNSNSMMSMSDLGETQMSRAAQENLDILEHIYDEKMEIKSLMYKTDSYAKNTATTFRDSLTPDSHKKTGYQKSPYGQKLQISDYSRYLSPSPVSKRSKI